MRATFPALGSRDLRLFFAGQLVSVIGTWMQSVALGWLVITLTGSVFWLGVVTAVRFGPALIVTLPAGLLADRRDRRWVMVWTSVAGAVAAAVLALATLAEVTSIEWVVAVAFVAGTANAIEAPARQAYIAELAGADRRSAAIAMNSLIWNGARVVGPAIAGIVVALVGPGWVFVVNAVSYLGVVAALLAISYRPAIRDVAANGAYRELLAYLRATPSVAWLLALVGASSMFASGYLYLGPAIARDLGSGADGLGILMAAAGVGAVIAGLRLAVRPMHAASSERRRPLIVAAGISAVGAVGVAFAGSLALTAAMFVVTAVGTVSFNVSTNTRIQSIVPDRLRGRIMSLYALMLLGLIPPGSLLLGALGDAIGAAQALAAGGAIWLVISLPVLASVSALRRAP